MEKNEYTKKIKNYLKNMKYQLSLVYSKEDVPNLWNKCSKINPLPNFQIYAAG